MKKILKSSLAVILSLAIVFSLSTVTYAADNSAIIGASNAINAIINGAFAVVGMLFPGIGHTTIDKYYAEGEKDFYEGTDEFIDEPADGAVWSLGFAKASFVPEKLANGSKKYYTGGYFTQKIDSVYDDQGANVIAINDGSGRGTAVFAAIDGIGVSGKDILNIRAQVKKKLADKGIEDDLMAVNINSTHCHTVIDTQGISLSLLGKMFINMFAFIPFVKPVRSMDEEFLELMIEGTSDAIVEAYTSMESGELSYFVTPGMGRNDDSGLFVDDEYNYLYNKRYSTEGYQNFFACFEFTPFNESSRSTIFANVGAHPTTIERTTKKLSADFPNYLEEKLGKENFNFMFIQGAQCPVSVRKGNAVSNQDVVDEVAALAEGDEFASDYKSAKELGYEFARLILESRENAKPVDPILNIDMDQVTVKLDRGLFQLGAASGLMGFNAFRDKSSKSGYSLVTEVGYIEIGSDIVLLTVPGELVPQLVYGDVVAADDAYLGTEWTLPATADLINSDKSVLVMGLCNDAIGYIIPDNDFSPFIADSLWSMEIGDWKLGEELFGTYHRHYEELLAGSGTAASSVIGALNNVVTQYN